MSTYLSWLKILSLFILVIFIFQGCAKDDAVIEPNVGEPNVEEPSIEEPIIETPIELYLTDCPFEADEVNVEILTVVLEDEEGNQEDLLTNSGIYNLLDFTDGIDTLLAYGDISIDNIQSIYIELGGQNTIIVEGETFPLQLEGNNTIEIDVNIESIDHLAFLVDFFACTSIVQNAGGFFLNPIIKFKGERGNSEELIEDLIEDFEVCYEIVYPISLLAKNGETLTATQREKLIDILINNEIKDVVFPINLHDSDGDMIQLNSVDDINLLADCDLVEEEEPLEGFEGLLKQLEECYDIVFPVNLINDNNEVLEANNRSELILIFENDKIENVEFPIQLIDTDGATININSPADLVLLDLDC